MHELLYESFKNFLLLRREYVEVEPDHVEHYILVSLYVFLQNSNNMHRLFLLYYRHF